MSRKINKNRLAVCSWIRTQSTSTMRRPRPQSTRPTWRRVTLRNITSWHSRSQQPAADPRLSTSVSRNPLWAWVRNQGTWTVDRRMILKKLLNRVMSLLLQLVVIPQTVISWLVLRELMWKNCHFKRRELRHVGEKFKNKNAGVFSTAVYFRVCKGNRVPTTSGKAWKWEKDLQSWNYQDILFKIL